MIKYLILMLLPIWSYAGLPDSNWYYQDLNCNGIIDSINLDDYGTVPDELRCGSGKIRVIHFANNKELCVNFNSLKAHLDHGDELPSNCPLPVEMGSMTFESDDCSVIGKWSTLSEVNNDYFLVQHSYDAYNWSVLGEVKGNGNSNVRIDYEIEMTNLIDGINYFRIVQFDFDGKKTFHDIKVVEMNCSNDWQRYEVYDYSGRLLDFGSYIDYEHLPGNTVVKFINGKQIKIIKRYEIR